MQRDAAVAAAIDRSGGEFRRLVVPIIRQRIGATEIIEVETAADSRLTRCLDIDAGIDAFYQAEHAMPSGRRLVLRGIASRVQAWKGVNWRTTTVRLVRGNGSRDTEFAKRLVALRNMECVYLYPFLTCQAYLCEDRSAPVGIGLVETRRLIGWLDRRMRARATMREDVERVRKTGKRLRCDGWSVLRNGDDGAVAAAVEWDALRADGIDVDEWSAGGWRCAA